MRQRFSAKAEIFGHAAGHNLEARRLFFGRFEGRLKQIRRLGCFALFIYATKLAEDIGMQ